MKIKRKQHADFILQCFDIVAKNPELANEFRKKYATEDEMTRSAIKSGMIKKEAVKLLIKLAEPYISHIKIEKNVKTIVKKNTYMIWGYLTGIICFVINLAVHFVSWCSSYDVTREFVGASHITLCLMAIGYFVSLIINIEIDNE